MDQKTLGTDATSQGRIFTYDELISQLGETLQPCELWDGELIMSPTPSFYHQKIVLRFYEALVNWVRGRDLGEVSTAPIDMVLSPHRVVQPDVVFISKARLDIIQNVIIGPADLVVEVVSLGGRTRDRIEKRDLYEQYGIREYWIVDPESQTVEVLVLTNGKYDLLMRRGQGETVRSALIPGFEISVNELFDRRP